VKSPISGIKVTNTNMRSNIINIILYGGGERRNQKERDEDTGVADARCVA